MKCKKCGYRAKDINSMRKHYMKAHPAAMKHHGTRKEPKYTQADSRKIVGWAKTLSSMAAEAEEIAQRGR